MRAQLVSCDKGPPVEITRDLTLVGRGEMCDVRLEHKSVSKMHCVIVKTDGLLLLRDLGSTNGTRVNGQRVRRAALLPNDQLHIANLKFRVLFGALALPDLPEEKTQQIDARELDDLLKHHDAAPIESDSAEMPLNPFQTNPLPDVYPDEPKEK